MYPVKDDPEAMEFCRRFVHDKTRLRFVMGRNEYAASIAGCVELDGFIDDFTDDKEFLGKPIYRTADVPKDSMVVSAVVLGRPLTSLKRIKNSGISDCLDYFKFLKYSGFAIKEIDLFNASKLDIERNRYKYQKVYDLLADKQSQETLNNLLNFRISGDLSFMQGYKHSPQDQYFEKFLKLREGEVFVDAGGFDGQTSLEFIRQCPAYKSIHFFEPDAKNLERARNNLSSYKNIHYYRMGLAESQKTLRFSSGAGSASKLSEEGDIEIPVDTLDDRVKDKITFLKMDIEGAEEMALRGAREHILRDHPKMAICCYHRFNDFWKIPEIILMIRENYNIYLRHYEEGFVETVMYFIPPM
jgi:FkbM family methyltransferase